MNFTGSTRSSESTYFSEKLERAKIKLKEFPTFLKIVSFNSANQNNHTENFLLNLMGMFGANFYTQEELTRYNNLLKKLDILIDNLMTHLSKDKKNNLIKRLNMFGKENFELMNELEFFAELKDNQKISEISYENAKLGNHDFNLKIDGEEFNIEVTSLSKSQIQQITEDAFNSASKEIFSTIPQKTYLQIEVTTDRLLRDGENKVAEIKDHIIRNYETLKDIILVSMDGLCIIEKNLGNPNQSLYDIQDQFDYYRDFGQRMKKLLSNSNGISYLKNIKINDITESSIVSFIIGPAKFGTVEIHSQCLHPSKSEDLRKKSLINQLKRRIKDKITYGQLNKKKNSLIAVRFEDFSFMNYSSDSDIWWEENGKELKGIVENVFQETQDKEILGVLLYENTIKKSRLFQNPDILINEDILKKIEALKN